VICYTEIFHDACKYTGSIPQQAHIIIYADESDFLDWHTDKPLVEHTAVTALRLGGPRKVQIRSKNDITVTTEFFVYEGDMREMSWEAQQTYEHRVPKICTKEMDLLLRAHRIPIFYKMGEHVSGAIVGRSVRNSRSKKCNFSGLEQLFIPNSCLQNIAISMPPRADSQIGPIRVAKCSVSDMWEDLKPGTMFTRKKLCDEWIHKDQNKSLVYDLDSRIAHSVIFGYCDIFGPCVRLWSTNGNSHYVFSLLRSGYYSSPIRVILNLKYCNTAISYHKSRKLGKICWHQNGNLRVLHLKRPFYMYAGLMYVVSYYFEKSLMYIQFGNYPPPRSWGERYFSEKKKML